MGRTLAHTTLALLLAILLLARLESIGAYEQQSSNTKIDYNDDLEQQELEQRQHETLVNTKGKFIVMPSALSKFLLSKVNPSERQAILSPRASGNNGLSNIISNKRLDALTGYTIGKRSPASYNQLDRQSAEFVNWEPMYERQFSTYRMPPFFLFRWSPTESSYEGSANQAA